MGGTKYQWTVRENGERRGRAPAVVAPLLLAYIGYRLGTRFSLATVAGLGALALVVTVALTQIWIRMKRFDLGARDHGVVLAAVNGVALLDRARPSPAAPPGPGRPVDVRVTVVPDKIIIVAFPGQEASEPVTLPIGDVTSIVWVSRRTFGRRMADVRLTSLAGSPITLQLSCPGNSGDLEHLRQTLHRLVPPGVMTSELPAVSSVQPWMVTSSGVLILVAFALLGAAGLGPAAGAVSAGRSPASNGPAPKPGPSATIPIPIGPLKPLEVGAAPASAPGYFPMASSKQVPLTLGRPWGRACASVSLEFHTDNASVAGYVGGLVEDVEQFLPLTIAVSFGESRYLYGPHAFGHPEDGPWSGNGQFAEFPVYLGPAGPTARGETETDGLVSWKTLASKRGKGVTFDWIKGEYPADITDPNLTIRALRLMIARSVGLMYSDRPGSGLRRNLNDSIDGFSAEDMHALQVFSGCGAPATAR